MAAFLDLQFWAFFLWFWVAVFIAFFIPGNTLLRKFKLETLPQITLSVCLGIVLWALQGYLFGYLNLRILSYGYLALFLIWWFSGVRNFRLKVPSWPPLKFNRTALFIIFVGVVFQLSAVWFIGRYTENGLYFCCRGVPDDIFHLSLTYELTQRFPPDEPGMYPVPVKNYHYAANLVMADTIRVFKLPLMPTVYQYFPFLLSLLLAFTALSFARLLNLSPRFANWLLFFLYFHGDIIYLLLFLRGKGLDFSVTIFDDATKLLAGPTRSFSIVLLFTGLSFLFLWLKGKKAVLGIISALVFGSLIGFKVYTGIFALTGLGFLGLYFLFKKNWRRLWPLFLAVFLSLVIYLPVNAGAGGISFNGLYRFENFLAQPAFGLQNLELARLNFLNQGNYLRAFPYELLGAILYFPVLFGTVLIGIFQTRKSLSAIPAEINIFLIGAAFVTGTVGLFFVQDVGGLNSVQFLLNLYFIFAIFAALFCAYVLPNLGRGKWAIVFLLIAFTLPRPVHEALENFLFVSRHQGYTISSQELAGLNFLKNNTPAQSLILLSPELAKQENLMYVSFLTNRPVYLAGYIGVLSDHQAFGAAKRLLIDQEIFTSSDANLVSRLLTTNRINYLYLFDNKSSSFKENLFTQEFINNKVRILKVN